MSSKTPWSDPKRIARLSRESFGVQLADRVAKKLRTDNGAKGIWNQHRDWCGHGLLFLDGEFLLVAVSDGMPRNGPILKSWSVQSDFVSWLARQSDYSCSGADETIPELSATSQFNLNNQRLTRSRLSAYVATEHTQPVFRRFLEATLDEFAFMSQDYEFQLAEAEQVGREFVVSYAKGGVGGVTIQYEPFSSILVTVSWRHDNQWIWTNAVLNKLAGERAPEWQPPTINYEDTFPNFRGFMKSYAFLLQVHFQDFLTTHRSDWEQDPGPEPASTVEAPEYTRGSAADDGSTHQPAPEPPAERRISPRTWGFAMMFAAFIAMVLELRWFTATGSPEPTGSTRSNLGILLLMAIPWIIFAVGTLQLLSDTNIRDYRHQFSVLPLVKRLGVAASMIVVLVLATIAASTIATGS